MKAVVLCAAMLVSISMAVSEPPASVTWNASQFMVKARVTRYLLNGSSIERKYTTFKYRAICNGWIADPPVQTCGFMLDSKEDLNYSYRIHEIDADGREVGDILCQPMATTWQCRPVIK